MSLDPSGYQISCYSDNFGTTWHGSPGGAAAKFDSPAMGEGDIVELYSSASATSNATTLLYDIRIASGDPRSSSAPANPPPKCGNGVTGCRLFYHSTNGGVTWHSPQLRPDLPDPGCKGSIIRWTTPSGKRGIVASNPRSTWKRCNVTLYASLGDCHMRLPQYHKIAIRTSCLILCALCSCR